MVSFVSSFGIISVVLPDPKVFFWVATSVADAPAFNPNGIKTLLACSLSTFSMKDKLDFSNDSRGIPRNPSDCPNLC